MKLNDLLKEFKQDHLIGKLSDDDINDVIALKALEKQENSITNLDFKTSDVIALKSRESDTELKGIESYQQGEVAVIMVAGGQGTRLGFSGPKGCFKTSLVKKKSLYQIHAEKVLASSLKTGQRIPFLIMTSPATDKPTREFFKENNYFGLSLEQVHFFKQATVPSLSKEGKLLLNEEGKLLKNPDGHGGCFTALVKSGLLAKLKQDGIKHLVYIQVDNYLAPIYDPYLIGLAIEKNADVITKVVEKTKPEEKVGLLVNLNGADSIQEYINLPDKLLSEKQADGKLKYRWGNTAMHYWSVDFLNNLKDTELPFHASIKPLKTENGEVEGFKYERFIFDLLPLAKVSLGLEIDRNYEFCPLKNKSGNDSIETVHQISSSLYQSWLKDCDFDLDKQIEISPLLAINSQELKQCLNLDSNLVDKLKAKTDRVYLE